MQSRLDPEPGRAIQGACRSPRTHQALLRLCLQERKPEVVTTGYVNGYDDLEEIRTWVGVFDEQQSTGDDVPPLRRFCICRCDFS